MRNSAENKPFRIARYCSCPTFLHSRERGKVATVSRRSRLDSPPPTDKGDKWRKHGTDGTEGRRRREFERAIGYRFVARFRLVPLPFTYRGDPSFCFSLVSPAAFLPLPPQCGSAVSRKPDHRLPSQQESERSTGENQVLARNVP